MKIQRLMLAVLAVCGTSAALAQSSVTVYGRVNTTIENQKAGNEKVTGMFSNSSYVGFRGVEDLGGGLKAGFQLETQFNSDDGSGAGGAGMNFVRQSEVNLSGGFGMIRMGSFDASSYSTTADYISMHNHDTGSSADQLYADIMPRGNKLAYRTPTFGGVTGEIQYGFGEKVSGEVALPGYGEDAITGARAKDAIDASLTYANGPLGLGLGYTRTKLDQLTLNAGSLKQQQLGLRASYAIGDLTLGAYYQYYKANETALGLDDSAKRHAYRLSAMYTLGASEFHANVGRAGKMKFNGDSLAGTAATQWTLGYNYNLSKRTKVYGYFTKVSNGDNIGYKTGVDGDNFRSIAVGVRHLF